MVKKGEFNPTIELGYHWQMFWFRDKIKWTQFTFARKEKKEAEYEAQFQEKEKLYEERKRVWKSRNLHWKY